MARKPNTPIDEDKRAHVMALLASGLILQNEAALLAGATRQRVHQWAAKAGMRPAAARRRYLKALMSDRR